MNLDLSTVNTAELTGHLHFRFEPAPVQVLLSEEITGSLRKLKVQLYFSLKFPKHSMSQLDLRFGLWFRRALKAFLISYLS